MKLNDGKVHKISYLEGELFIDSEKIASKGHDVVIEFLVADGAETVSNNPEFLSINAGEDVKAKDVGPGQR